MRKVGKYEKMRKQALLQTYITSLLCLVLCVTMFFGTTAAWFTDTTTSQGNQIYVGKLEVELKHATFSAGVQQKGNDIMDAVTENYQVFKTIDNGGIRWEPGYTAVEKFELTENGDLAFNYQMGMECEIAENTYGTIPEKEAIANAITVWNYVGTKAEETVSLPANFNELTALDVDADGKADWERVDTLYNVITNHKPVFKGQMDKTTVTATKTEGEGENQTTVPAPAKAYHMIALHMDETFSDASVQGKTLDNLTIKLVATQLPSEQDAFGSNYDNLVYVETLEQLQAALNNAADGVKIVFANDIEGDVVATQKPGVSVTIDGNDKHFTGVMTVFGDGNHDSAESLHIKNIRFIAANGAESCIVSPEKEVFNKLSNSHNVTIEKCTFTDPDGEANCAAIRTKTGGDNNWVIKDCTVDNTMHSIAQVANIGGKLTIDNCTVSSKNGANLNATTNLEMTNCEFNVKGYAVRFGPSSGGNLGTPKTFLLKDNNIASACDGGDAAIMFRTSAVDATLTLTNNTISATNKISGDTEATTIIYN